jgi:general secretion pathway protein K
MPSTTASFPRRALRRSERGFVLVAVLWGLVILTFVAAALGRSVAGYVKVTANAVGAAQAEALADAGVSIAIVDITARRIAAGHRARFPLDGTPGACALGEAGRVVIAVEDDGGKVDLNGASEALLRALFEAAGVAPGEAEGLAARLADYRDSDEAPRLGGAERTDYEASGLPYGPRNAPLLALDELALVAGMPAAVSERVRGLATVSGGHAGIDPAVAPLPLLRALADGAGGLAPGARIAAADRGPRRDMRVPADIAQRSARRAFTITVAARTAEGATFVREARVDFPSPRPGLQRLTGWRRGGALAEPVLLEGALPPC